METEDEKIQPPEVTVESVEVIPGPIPPPHEIIQAATQMLNAGPSSSVAQYEPYAHDIQVYAAGEHPTTPPINPLSVFEKFPDVTAQLRADGGEDGGLNLFRVRKLNLAATVETLERAVSAHENFPSADAGIAVAKLAEQVNQLTRELEKAQNPYVLYDRIMNDTMEPLTASLVKALAEEARWLISQFEYHLPEGKRPAFKETVKQMAMRIGPPLKDALEISKSRLLVALNLQDKKPR